MMDTTTLHQTINAVTNVLLAIQCIACGLFLRRYDDDGARAWSAFFLLSAVAAAAGVIKHGFGSAIGASEYAAVLAITNVTSGLSIYFAQYATIRAHVRSNRLRLFHVAIALQALLFLVANAMLGPRITLLIANSAIGLLPVIAAESLAARNRDPGAAAIAGGFAVSTLAALAYMAGISAGPWFNHIDVAHAVMALSFHSILRGVIQRTAPERAQAKGAEPCPT